MLETNRVSGLPEDEDVQGPFTIISEEGIAAQYPERKPWPLLVAPSTTDCVNTIRSPLAPIGCWSLSDARFKFASSFLCPRAAADLRALAVILSRLEQARGQPPLLSIFGHADPIGRDDSNRRLSGRRAAAVYAILTRRTEIWEDLYRQTGECTPTHSSDDWGPRVLSTILDDFGYAPTDDFDAAVRQFQSDQALTEDGDPGPLTREALFGQYMDRHCTDRQGNPLRLEPGDFLGRGKDARGKGDYQGCGEFNPLLRFSESEHQALDSDPSARNAEHEPNRRVVAFFFDRRDTIAPKKWPCPSICEGSSSCHKRFWSDSATRYTRTAERRLHEDGGKTFRCRFYERLARQSPCERLRVRAESVFVFARLLDDGFACPLTNLEYVLRAHDADVEIRGTTDDQGILHHELLPDDAYEIECDGLVEPIEVYYMQEIDRHPEPWNLRLRGLAKNGKA